MYLKLFSGLIRWGWSDGVGQGFAARQHLSGILSCTKLSGNPSFELSLRQVLTSAPLLLLLLLVVVVDLLCRHSGPCGA
jgi:hypothetical protein